MAENKPEIMIVEDAKVESYLIEVIEDKLVIIEDKPEDKPKKTRKLRVPSRTVILEDGTVKYNNKPKDPQYFVKYYHSTRKFKEAVVVNCELCNRQTTAGHKHRHQKTNICKQLYNLRLSKEAEEKSTEDDDDAKPPDDDDDDNDDDNAKSSDHDDDNNYDDDDDDDDDK